MSTDGDIVRAEWGAEQWLAALDAVVQQRDALADALREIAHFDFRVPVTLFARDALVAAGLAAGEGTT